MNEQQVADNAADVVPQNILEEEFIKALAEEQQVIAQTEAKASAKRALNRRLSRMGLKGFQGLLREATGPEQVKSRLGDTVVTEDRLNPFVLYDRLDGQSESYSCLYTGKSPQAVQFSRHVMRFFRKYAVSIFKRTGKRIDGEPVDLSDKASAKAALRAIAAQLQVGSDLMSVPADEDEDFAALVNESIEFFGL